MVKRIDEICNLKIHLNTRFDFIIRVPKDKVLPIYLGFEKKNFIDKH